VKKYGVGVVRQRLAEALDYAEQGVPVVIERRGVQYRLSVDRPKTRRKTRPTPYIEILDPVVEQGEWTWDWSPGKITLQPRRPRT
jgi:antitoxin (DNA-binding transcriptional repressor) of toxin-antitoxin stability system